MASEAVARTSATRSLSNTKDHHARPCRRRTHSRHHPRMPSKAATPAEDLITQNIHSGFDILNDARLSQEQRRAQFEGFLLGITDLKRVAVFTLGEYGAKASRADRNAFATAFQRYAVTVYQSY